MQKTGRAGNYNAIGDCSCCAGGVIALLQKKSPWGKGEKFA